MKLKTKWQKINKSEIGFLKRIRRNSDKIFKKKEANRQNGKGEITEDKNEIQIVKEFYNKYKPMFENQCKMETFWKNIKF